MDSLRPSAPQDSRLPTAVEQRVLTITREVLSELGAQHAISNLTPSASLERDLGLGSLERVELVSRLESDFAVSLPDQVAAAAETLKDLVVGLLQPGLRTAAVARALRLPPQEEQPRRETWGAADTATTLTEALIRHCEVAPERPHVYLHEEDDATRTISYGDLLREATAVARGLEARGLEHGRSVALMLPTSEDFFSCFFGILFAGGVPVPIYPPLRADQIEEYARRQSGILRNAEAQFLITFRRAEILGRLLRPGVPSLEAVLTPENFRRSKGNGSPREAEDPTQAVRRARAFAFLNPSRTALIQYTSGSTGDPKGVVLSHSDLLTNIRASGAAMEVCRTDVGVSWLPLYHDMGLIASWLLCLCYGVPIAILSPLAFLRRPERWLWAIHHHRGTLSPGPNFAYELCAGKISDEALEGLDLSCWRNAFNGAEPVSPDTIDHFAERFAPYGFRREAMMPVYGLAESTVGLCLPPVGRGPLVDVIRRDRFENDGIAEPVLSGSPTTGSQTEGARSSASPLRFVSVGRAIKGHEVKIVDGQGQPVGERRQGQLLFRGPSTTSGYFRNPQATAASLHDGWWDSGDYAYRADGEIYITGRTKDVIIKGGRNIYPHEIEEVTAQVPGIRRGCVAVFGLTDARMGTEKLVVIAETREKGGPAQERIRGEVIEKVSAAVGIPPDTVVLAPPKTIPKTSSGKLRRDATRRLYESGKFHRRPAPAWVQLAKLSLRAAGSSLRRRIRTLGRVGFAAYVGLVMASTMLPGWILVALIPGRRVALRLSQGWARLFLRLVGCPLQVEGLDHLKGNSPCVLVANHASYLDPVVILAALPGTVRMVAKQEAKSWPIIGTILRKAGHITVDRRNTSQSIGDTDRIQNALREGSSVLFFPEGTFTRAKGVRPFKLGAFKAAVETSLPVLPVAISGTRRILRDRSWLPRRGPICVTIRPPLQPTENHWREVVRLRDAARNEIVSHCDEEALDLLVAGLPIID